MRGTIVAIGVAIAVVGPAHPAAAGAAPACTPGTLVSSAPYLPSEVLLTRDGRQLIVVDRGALTVRDPATLAVRRTLLPFIDGWQSVYVSPDGRSALAETIDGLQFSFDTASWRATRLADNRAAIPGRRRDQDQARWTDVRFQGLSALTENEARFWQAQRPLLGLPALPAGVEASAVAHAIVRTQAGQTVLDPLDPIAPGDDPSRFRVVVADTAGTLHLYDDQKEVKSSAVLAGKRIVRLDVSGQRILAALATGEVVLLDPGLAIEARVMVMPAPPALATVGVRRVPVTEPGKETNRHGIMAMQYDPASRRLTYVSTAHAIGVFDIGARRTAAELHATGNAIVDALFVNEARVALLTDAGVSLWDAGTGTRRRERAGDYLSLFAAGGGVLALGARGTGDLLDPVTLAVRRRVCFLTQSCDEKPVRPDGVSEADWNRMSSDTRRGVVDALMPREDRRFEAAARRVYVTRSPDGRSLAVLHPPIEAEDRRRAGALTLWDARTLAVRRRIAIDSCYDWKLAYAGPRMLAVCGDQHRDATTLARVERPAKSAEGERRSDDSDLTAVGSATVEILRSPRFDGGDVVSVVDRGGKPLLDIARPESKANAPELRIADHERAQFRSRTFAVAAPGGRRFLLAGRGAGGEGELPGLVTVSGPLQVWCTPTQPIADTTLPLPPEPQTAEVDGIAESALDGFPEKIVGAAEVAGGVLVLGSNLAGDAQSLVAVDTATGRLTPQSLPAGGPWLHILPAPGGETAWLQGKGMVVRREMDQRWTSFALDARRDETPFFAPLSARTAVHVVRRACTPEENAASKSERNLREYYAHNRPRLTVPAEVEGSKIELMIDAQGPDDQGAQQNLRRRRDAVAALLASGAGFAAAQARAIKDPQIGASTDTRLSLSGGRMAESDRPLARLLSARPGDIVGPIASKSTDGFRRSERLYVRFVRVDKIVPERLRPFSDLTTAVANTFWHPVSDSGGDCADVTLLGDAKTAPRTVLPPHAARDIVVWRGGFAALGNALLVFRDGAWASPTSPLATAIASLRPDEGTLASGTNLYVRRPGGLQVIDVATGKAGRTIALDEHASPRSVAGPPGGGEIIWVTTPGDNTGTALAIDAAGRASPLGPPRAPPWAALVPASLVPGQTARYWITDVALLRRDGAKGTAMFNAAARRRGLALRRRFGSD